jgi:predicted Zn finger-like uncharacterized protein
MKITCPHCSTNYNIDDSRISEKGLLVKCSVCENQYRVKKKVEQPVEQDDIVGVFHRKMEQESDSVNGDKSRNEREDGSSIFEDDEDDGSSLFDDDPELSEDTAQKEQPSSVPDLAEDDGSPEATVNYIVNVPQDTEPEEEEKDPEVEDNGENEIQDDGSDSLDLDDGRLFSDDEALDVEGKTDENIERFDLFGESENKDGTDDEDLFPGLDLAADRYDDEFSLGDSDPEDSPPLFEDEPENDSQSFGSEVENNNVEKPDDFIKNLFDAGGASDTAGDDEGSIYFKKKDSGEILGPFAEDEIEDLMVKGVISPDDDISYDGFSWGQDGSGGGTANDAEEEGLFDHDMDIFQSVDDQSSISLGSNIDENDELGSSSVHENTNIGLFSDSEASEFEGTSLTGIANMGESVDHVFIPEELTDSGLDKTGPAKKIKKKKSRSGIPFFAVLIMGTLIIIGLIGGGTYYYLNYIAGTKGDVLDNISESIAVHTGTLLDVREALDKDLPQDYIKSIGILKQYIKPGETAPSSIGLDGQVKFNLIISYDKRVEQVAVTDKNITDALSGSPDNLDLIKAKALSHYIQRQYDQAAMLLQSHASSDDPEIFYILGLVAFGKNDFKNAETFYNTGFVKSNGKSAKITYALADMKFRNGDTQSSMAFLNRIISENRSYLKAYLLKGQILMNNPDRLAEAELFLKEIDRNIISEAEDFQKAQFFQMLAQVAHRNGDLKEAIANYEKAVEINKTDTSSLSKIADFYVQTANSSKAMEYYDKALAIDAKFPPAILGKAEIFTKINQKDKVYLELAKLDVKSIRNPEQLIRLGRIYYDLGDKAKSAEFFDLAIESNPSMIEPYLSKGVILLEVNKLEELRAISDKLGVLGKDTYAYELIKAIIFHKEGNHKSAEQSFQIALKRNSKGDERVYHYYGVLLYDQGKYGQASKYLEMAYKISPQTYKYLQHYVESLEKENRWNEVISILEGNDFRERPMFRSYVSLSNAFLAKGKYDESLNNINRAIDLYSGNSYLHYLKSNVLYSMEKYGDAEAEINKAVVLDMRSFDNYVMYARILIKRGDFKGAIEKIEAAQKIDDTDESLMLLKGIVYKNLDDYRSAIKYFRKVKSSILRREAYLEIGETYLQVNNKKEALKYLRLAEKSGNRNAHKHLARINYEMGKIDTAVSYYRKSLKADKNDIAALRQLGYIYKEKGEYPRALAYFNRYLKLIRDANERQMIQDEIYFLNRNLSETQKRRMEEDPTMEMDEEDINERAKELYLEGRALRIEDPELAREKFREVMRIVPKDNEYYQKAFRSFNRLHRENQ